MGADFFPNPRLKAEAELAKKLVDGEATLSAYRSWNAPELRKLQTDVEWLRVIDRPTVSSVGRNHMGGWEVRDPE